MLFDCCGDAAVGYQTPYMTQAAMEAAYPTGDYTLASTNSITSASDSVTVPYAGSLYALTPPELDALSFNALASSAAVAGLTVTAAPWTSAGGTSGQDFFTIYDYTTHATVLNIPGASSGTSSFLIAPGVLTAGDSYVSELIFDDYVGSYAVDSMGATIPVEARSDLRTLDVFSIPSSVPEPSTWVLLLLASGLMGATLRRRRRDEANCRLRN